MSISWCFFFNEGHDKIEFCSVTGGGPCPEYICDNPFRDDTPVTSSQRRSFSRDIPVSAPLRAVATGQVLPHRRP